ISLFAAFYLYFECMVIGAAIADYMTAKYEPDKDKDYLIILGCGIRKDGTPTPLLKSRIDRAIRFYKAQLEQTGRALVFIPSGGQGKDEIISESECMRRYLLEQGIPGEQILKEEQSTNTQENMKYSKEMIDALNPSAKVAFSTTNYHVFRSGMMARRVKMKAQGIGAPTKWYFWPNAAVREFVGLLTQHRGKQILILLGMVVVYLLLTFLRFRI
ncbi:MAG: YdcF family protein, partial [Lachnospiraceae bacterium]|nr:YdcF family protein [Lachnospiraceae bacterium]